MLSNPHPTSLSLYSDWLLEMPICPLHSNVPSSNLSSLSLLSVFFMFLKTSCSFWPWHCSPLIFLLTLQSPQSFPGDWFLLQPRLTWGLNLDPPFLTRNPSAQIFFPILMAANTQSWWLTDLRLMSCPLLKVYSHVSDWPLAIFAWNSSHCLRFNTLLLSLPSPPQKPVPFPSSFFLPCSPCLKVIPASNVEIISQVSLMLIFLTWRFSPSCWIRHFCWFLSSKLLLPPWVSISFFVSSS